MGLVLCPSHATIDRPCHYLNCMLQRNHIMLEGLGQLGTVSGSIHSTLAQARKTHKAPDLGNKSGVRRGQVSWPG